MWPSLAIGVPRIDSGMCTWLRKNKLVPFQRLIFGFDGWRMSSSTVIAKQGRSASGAEGRHLVRHTYSKILSRVQQVEMSIAEGWGRREESSSGTLLFWPVDSPLLKDTSFSNPSRQVTTYLLSISQFELGYVPVRPKSLLTNNAVPTAALLSRRV